MAEQEQPINGAEAIVLSKSTGVSLEKSGFEKGDIVIITIDPKDLITEKGDIVSAYKKGRKTPNYFLRTDLNFNIAKQDK